MSNAPRHATAEEVEQGRTEHSQKCFSCGKWCRRTLNVCPTCYPVVSTTPQYCAVSRKYCLCEKRCDDTDYGDRYDELTTHCVCDCEPDEEEQAAGRCKACGKPY